MNTAVISFLLCLATAAASSGLKEYNKNEKDAAACPGKNLQCSRDCKKINFCATASGNGVAIRDCGSKYCSIRSGIPQCDSYACPYSPPKPICGVVGSIPSPYSCYSFFICALAGDTNPTEFKCPDTQVFSTTKGECWSGVCVDPPIACNNAGENGVIDIYNRIFCYYCNDNNRPLIIKCADLPIPLPPPPQV